MKCPYCGENIQVDARKCRYCGEWLSKQTSNKVAKNIFVGLTLFLILAAGLYVIRNYEFVGVQKDSKDEEGLKLSAEKSYALLEEPTEGNLRKYYKLYLASSEKIDKTEEDFLTEEAKFKKNRLSEGFYAVKYRLNDVYIDGDYGFADRTVDLCADEKCLTVKEKWRYFQKYVYENNKWKSISTPDNESACPRQQMYDMEPEFLRAVSLISQRLPKNSNIQFVKNCLKIRYARSESEIQDAEGLFRFIPGQSPLALDIIVSPRYMQKDDILTAFLLSHEGAHAANYAVSLRSGTQMDCYQDEGSAFNAQYFFLTQLNPEEKNAFDARFYRNPSSEIVDIAATFSLIKRQQGDDFLSQATSYVKSHPSYQAQCSKRSLVL